MLEKLFARFSSAPKTLPQATETLGEAKATLDSVAALFTAAGLNLEQILAAGPDALKAHIDSIDNATELAEALQENERLEAAFAAAGQERDAFKASLDAAFEVCKTIGLSSGVGAFADAAAFKTSFDAHVSKQATLALAKTGHPPAHVPASDVTPAAKATGAELHAQWKAMKPSPDRLAFFSKHEAALTAFERNGAA